MGPEGENLIGSRSENLSYVELIEDGDFPEWMLFEVFLRLPVKVLFKFKIVSKQWLSMISDPSLASMYVARKSLFPHSQPWTFISCFLDMSTFKNFLGQKLLLRRFLLGFNFLHPQMLPHCVLYIIFGISNGMVLYGSGPEVCRSAGLDGYYICNPITGQQITLLPHEHCYGVFSTGFVTKVGDNVLASYRVVCIDDFKRRSSIFRFAVYFSEICKWMEFNIDFNEEIYFHTHKKRAALGEILHWMVSGHRIMAYDPYNKPDSFRLISLPGVQNEDHDGDKIVIDEHQGHLRYIEVNLDEPRRPNEVSHNLSIWILNDYDSGEWCMQHRISIQRDGLSLLPLFFHPFDSNIVYMDKNDDLYSFNVKTRNLEAVEDSESYYNEIFYRVSLLYVLPAWPISINPSLFDVTRIDVTRID